MMVAREDALSDDVLVWRRQEMALPVELWRTFFYIAV